MKKIFIFIVAICLLPNLAFAGIGIAVAKDESGSSIICHIAWVNGTCYEAESIAKQKLKDEGYNYNKVYTLTGGEERGHDLNSGYWVVVECTRNTYDGKRKTSFGLGASSHSYSEAEKRAVSNLSQYDWGWSKSDGYEIFKRGTF